MNQNTLKSYSEFSIDFFGKNGLKWFSTIDIIVNENKVIFRGLHELDDKFSYFFANFYKHLISEFPFNQ